MRYISIVIAALLPAVASAASPDFSPMTQLIPTQLVVHAAPAAPVYVQSQPAAVCVGGVCTIPQAVCGPQGCNVQSYSQPVYAAPPVRYYARRPVRYFRTYRPVRSVFYGGVCGPGGCR